MPNINTAQFSLTGMGKKRSFADRLSDMISVKDFGAVGNGIANDQAAIQACFDAAYGPFASPHGGSPFGSAAPGEYANKAVFFPAGDYKVSGAFLKIGLGMGVTIIGAGSQCTRIFWSGSQVIDPDTDADPAGVGIAPVITFATCWHTSMRGITIDASGIQNVAMRAGFHPSGGGYGGGHDGLYTDVVLTNTTNGSGFLTTASAMGSERYWLNCQFTNHRWGFRTCSGNGLNYAFYNCHFANNSESAYSAGTGGQAIFHGCSFAGQGLVDISQRSNMVRVVGCSSTSPSFVGGDGVIVGCTHNPSVPGYFYNMYLAEGGGDYGMVKCTGSRTGINSKLAAVPYGPVPFLVFVGNIWDNPSFKAEFNATGTRNPAVDPFWRGAWEDGVMIP